MGGELADKPHIWVLKRTFALLFLFTALLLLPAGIVSDTAMAPEPATKACVQAQEIVDPPLGITPQPLIEPVSQQIEKRVAEVDPTVKGQEPPRTKRPASHPPVKISKKPSPKDRLHTIIEQVAMRHNVDPALIKAIIMAESGYNPKAVSKKGAIGLMQLMPRTAHELGVKELFNPENNVEAGVRYFKRLLRRFGGNVTLALAAYNAGSRKVRRYRGVPPIGATRYYVKKVFHYYRIYKKESSVRTDDA